MNLKGNGTKILMSIPTGLPSVAVVLAILWLTLARTPLGGIPIPHIPGLDKVVHACIFGGLMFVVEFDVCRWRIKRRKLHEVAALIGYRAVAAWSVCVSLFGGLIEVLQQAMKMGRGGDLADWVADVAGVVIAIAVSPAVISWLLSLKPQSGSSGNRVSR